MKKLSKMHRNEQERGPGGNLPFAGLSFGILTLGSNHDLRSVLM